MLLGGRHTVRVKCLAQEHRVVPRPGLETELFDSESSALNKKSYYANVSPKQRLKNRLDNQPLFPEMSLHSSLSLWGGTQTGPERAAEIEPS